MTSERVRLADGEADQLLVPDVAPVSLNQRLIAEAQMARAVRRATAVGHGPLFEPIQDDLLAAKR